MPDRQHIAFPNIAASLGGASRVEYSARFAWIHIPSQPEPVRVPRSKLPAVDQWTAFNLADAASQI